MPLDFSFFNNFEITAEKERELWNSSIFVFDSSALLDFYFYPESTRQEIFSNVLDKLKGKLWLPNHVIFEYLRNRKSVIRKPIQENYKPLIDDILTPIKQANGETFKKLLTLKQKTKKSDKHPYIENTDITIFEEELSEAFKKFDKAYSTKISEKEKEIIDLEANDTVLEYIQNNFTSGRQYSYEEILDITKEGEHRYKYSIPPGYNDNLGKDKKEGTQIFGDLIIWKQILEFASEEKKDIILLCNDLKTDWCEVDENKRIISPRHELVKEFRDKVGKDFWMYDPEQFLYKAKEILKSSITAEQISKVSEFLRPKKELIKAISFNESWILNHWGSNCAMIEGDNMIFTGTTAPNGTDGSHIDLTNFLEIGCSYDINCFVRSNGDTTAQFQLWCHDKSVEPNGVSEATPYQTPSTEGETIRLLFTAEYNKNIRIHLQYNPGKGKIEAKDVRVYKLII